MRTLSETLPKIFNCEITGDHDLKKIVSELANNKFDDLKDIKEQAEQYLENRKGYFEMGIHEREADKFIQLGEPNEKAGKMVNDHLVLDGIMNLKKFIKAIDERLGIKVKNYITGDLLDLKKQFDDLFPTMKAYLEGQGMITPIDEWEMLDLFIERAFKQAEFGEIQIKMDRGDFIEFHKIIENRLNDINDPAIKNSDLKKFHSDNYWYTVYEIYKANDRNTWEDVYAIVCEEMESMGLELKHNSFNSFEQRRKKYVREHGYPAKET